MTKRILLTHDDRDGSGCAIMFKRKYGDIETEFHDYHTIEGACRRLSTPGNYDEVFLADIAPDNEIVAKELADRYRDRLTIIDHHTSQIYLPEATIPCNIIFDTKRCGTLLCYELFKEEIEDEALKELALVINAWDMWLLDDRRRKRGEKLNMLHDYFGQEKFIEEFFDGFHHFYSEDKHTIRVLKKLRDDYVKKKVNSATIKTDEDGNDYAFVFAEKEASIIGNELCKGLDVKYALILNAGIMHGELRSIGDFDVGQLAKKMGGGGRKTAAGFNIKDIKYIL